MKTDQTGQMPRLIGVFAGCIGHFVDYDMLWLILLFSLLKASIVDHYSP